MYVIAVQCTTTSRVYRTVITGTRMYAIAVHYDPTPRVYGYVCVITVHCTITSRECSVVFS